MNMANVSEDYALDAIKLLKKEIKYFEQLAARFPDHSKGLKKHSLDCGVVVTRLESRINSGIGGSLATSLRTANVFLHEGNRLRLKLRVDLLKQQATSLELEASRWRPLKSSFRELAKKCREVALVCRDNVYTGSVDEVKKALKLANGYYEKSVALRLQQTQQRRNDRQTIIRRRIESLHSEASILLKKSGEMPSHARKLRQLADHCKKTSKVLEEKLEKASINQLEKQVRFIDAFLERVRQNRNRIEENFHAETMAKVPVVVEPKGKTKDDKAGDNKARDNVINFREAVAEEVQTDIFEVTQPVRIDELKRTDEPPKDSQPLAEKKDEVVQKIGDSTFRVKTTLDAEPDTIRSGPDKDKTIRFSVTSESVKLLDQSKTRRLLRKTSRGLVKFSKTVGNILLFVVGTLLFVTFIAIVFYLSGAGFSSIGVF